MSTPSPSDLLFSADLLPGQHIPVIAGVVALVIATISWFALSAQFDLTIGRSVAHGMSVLDGVARLSSYLTNLTALLSAVSFSALALRSDNPLSRFFRQPQVITAVTAYLMFVGVAYNLLLRQLWHPQGFPALVNESLHTVMPLLAAVYWIFFVPRFQVSPRQCLLSLVYPLAYLGVTLWRGSDSGFYPYPFINVRELGYPHVALNATGLLAGFLLLMAVLLGINHSGKARWRR